MAGVPPEHHASDDPHPDITLIKPHPFPTVVSPLHQSIASRSYELDLERKLELNPSRQWRASLAIAIVRGRQPTGILGWDSRLVSTVAIKMGAGQAYRFLRRESRMDGDRHLTDKMGLHR